MNFTQQFEKYDCDWIKNGVKLPIFEINKEYYQKFNLPEKCSNKDFLLKLIKLGFENKILPQKDLNFQEYQERIDKEFETIDSLGLIDYVLITWEIIYFCKENGIFTGMGRGSAAGCLLLFLLGVTEIDSVKHHCFFERFLNRSRCKFQDINGIRYYEGSLLMDCDLDISVKDRDRVIKWLEGKYKGKTSKLLTSSTFSTKILLKEVCKTVLEIDEHEANIISEMIPKIFGTVKTIEESILISKDFEKFAKENEKIINVCKKLYLLNKNHGVHPSAIIISADPIDELFPLQLTKDKETVTAYTMEDASSLAIKVDILGLRCCSLLEVVSKLTGEKVESIDLNSKFIYDNLLKLENPHGCFQIEADCNFRVLKQFKPKNLNQLAAVIACARPGGLEFVDQFAKFIETGERQSVHPFFDDVLKDSAGIPIYQESQLRMLNKIGFSLEESEVCRKVLGKKKLEEVESWKTKIRNKCKGNNLEEKIADIVCEVIQNSASYSFNYSHAISYASMCAATVYYKFKYPKEFHCALLNLTKDEPSPIEEIAKIQQGIYNFNLKLLAPHIIKSDINFTIEKEGIRFGLGTIKGISEKNIVKLDKFRTTHSNKFQIFHAANEAKIPLNVLSSLILCGSMDDMITESRSKIFLEACLWNLLTTREKVKALEIGESLAFELIPVLQKLNKEIVNDKGKPFIKDSRMDTIRKHFVPFRELYKNNKPLETFAKWYFEKELLGFPYSTTLIKIFKKDCPDLISISEISSGIQGEYIHFAGEVVSSTSFKSKEKKTPTLKMKVKDETGEIVVLMFDTKNYSNIQLCKEDNGRLPKESDIIIIRGQHKNDAIFANSCSIQDKKVFMKISEIKISAIKEESIDSETLS